MKRVRDEERAEDHLSVFDWLGAIVMSLVPVVNVAVLGYWAFRKGVRIERRNFGIAGLILIGAVIVVILSVFTYMVMTIDPQERIKAFLMVE